MPLDPILATIYGESGMGKTSDTLYAFPTALYIAAPGALNPSLGLLYIPEPKRVDCKTLDEATYVCNDFASKKDAPVAVAVDDLSLLVQRTVMQLQAAGVKGYDLWFLILNKIIKLADAARYSLKAHFVINAHVQPPHDVRGEYIKGGPMLPGKGAAALPKHCDVCLRAIAQKDRLIWPFAYQSNNSDDSYTTKDRNNVCANETPMNLAEIMRESGYAVPRLFNWQESVVEKLSARIINMQSKEEIVSYLSGAKKQIEAKYTTNQSHIGWTFRDAIDRAVIRRTRPSPLRRLGL